MIRSSSRHLAKARNIEDLRALARRALPRVIFDHIEGGGDDETTIAENRLAFSRWRLLPRVLVDVSERDLGIELYGERLGLPILLAPTGMSGFASWQGEIASARAAASSGTRLVLSTASAYSIEEVADATTEHHWFQLYPWGDRDLIESLVGRANGCGFSVLCVTVDVPVPGNRERDRRNGFTTRPRPTFKGSVDLLFHARWWAGYVQHRRYTMRNLGSDNHSALQTINRFVSLFNPSFCLDDLRWLRSLWPGPLIIKGILRGDDAMRCVDVGADGVIVSNHGGRQLDAVPAALDQLPEVVDRVNSQVPVLIDGGIRRGTDIVKALCLGAKACLIGRPYLYGLAAGGESGVTTALQCLRQEFDRTLTLLGCARVADLDRSFLCHAQPANTHSDIASLEA